MAPMRQTTNYSSSNYGEDAAARQANVLASCYLVDSSAALRGLHYCTTSVTAITSDNELALTYKSSKRRSATTTNNAGPGGAGRNNTRQRRGATSRIREECERFFCETLRAVFRDERNAAPRGSGLTGVYNHDQYHHYDDNDNHYSSNNGQLSTPPPNDYPFPDQGGMFPRDRGAGGVGVVAWMEIWDYVGGAGFRGFIVEDDEGEKSAFVFFDLAVVGRDLKQALIAIMELADGPLDCSKVVIAIDREIPQGECKTLMRGLQWAGFSLASLDKYSGGALDVTSPKWLFMAYED